MRHTADETKKNTLDSYIQFTFIKIARRMAPTDIGSDPNQQKGTHNITINSTETKQKNKHSCRIRDVFFYYFSVATFFFIIANFFCSVFLRAEWNIYKISERIIADFIECLQYIRIQCSDHRFGCFATYSFC